MSATAVDAPASAPAANETEATRRRRPSGVAVGVALIAALVLVRIFVAEPFRIPSQSMEPTLRPGDQALVSKLSGHEPERGQLVAFHSPRGGQTRATARPMMRSVGTAPKSRESSEFARLSPITNTVPGRTFTGPK